EASRRALEMNGDIRIDGRAFLHGRRDRNTFVVLCASAPFPLVLAQRLHSLGRNFDPNLRDRAVAKEIVPSRFLVGLRLRRNGRDRNHTGEHNPGPWNKKKKATATHSST